MQKCRVYKTKLTKSTKVSSIQDKINKKYKSVEYRGILLTKNAKVSSIQDKINKKYKL